MANIEFSNMRSASKGNIDLKIGERSLDDVISDIFSQNTNYEKLDLFIDQIQKYVDSGMKNALDINKGTRSESGISNQYKKLISELNEIKTQVANTAKKSGLEENVYGTQIMREIGSQIGQIGSELITANDIGRKIMERSTGASVSTLKNSALQVLNSEMSKIKAPSKDRKVSEDFEKTIQEIFDSAASQIKGFRADDVNVDQTGLGIGIPEINNIVFNAVEKASDKLYGVTKQKPMTTTANQRRTNRIADMDKVIKSTIAKSVKDNSNFYDKSSKTGYVDQFVKAVESEASQYAKAFSGAHLEKRLSQFKGGEVAARELMNGRTKVSLTDSLRRMEKAAQKQGLQMHLRLDDSNGLLKVGFSMANDSSIYKIDKNGQSQVDFDKVYGFSFGLDDGSGIFKTESGQGKINRLESIYDAENNVTFMSSTLEQSAKAMADAMESNWAQKIAYRANVNRSQEDMKRYVSSITSKAKKIQNGTVAPGTYKNTASETQRMGSGIGSKAQLELRKGIIGNSALIGGLAKRYGLYKGKTNDFDREKVDADIWRILQIMGQGSQEDIEKLIYGDKEFDYITKSMGYKGIGGMEAQLKKVAALGFRLDSLREGAAANDLLANGYGAGLYGPFYDLARSQSRGYSQTRMTLNRNKQSGKGPVVRAFNNGGASTINRSNNNETNKFFDQTFRSKLGESIGLYDPNEGNVAEQSIFAYATEKQIHDYFKKINKDYMPSVTYDSLLMDKNLFPAFSGYSDEGIKEIDLDEIGLKESQLDDLNKKKVRKRINNYLGIKDDIGNKRFHTYDILRDEQGNAIKSKNGKYQVRVTNQKEFGEGTKVGLGGGARATVQGISTEDMRGLLESLGYSSEQIAMVSGVKVSENPNERYGAGFIQGRADYAAIAAKKKGISLGELVTSLNNIKGFENYWELENDHIFAKDDNLRGKLASLSDDDRVEAYKQIVSAIENFANEKLGQEYQSFVSSSQDVDSKRVLTAETLNALDIAEYAKAVGDAKGSKHKIGRKERESVFRNIGVAKASTGEDYDALYDYLKSEMAIDDETAQVYKEEYDAAFKAVAKTSRSSKKDFKDNFGVSIGYGDQYDVNLGEKLNEVNYIDGKIPDQDKINSVWQAISDAIEAKKTKVAAEGGDADKVQAYIDLFGKDFNSQVQFGETGYSFSGNRVYLPKRDLIGNEEDGWQLMGYGKALNSLMHSVVDYGQDDSEDSLQRMLRKAEYAVADIVDDVAYKEGESYKRGQSKTMGHSYVAKQSSVNAEEILDENTNPLVRDILSNGIQLNRDDLRSMLKSTDKDILKMNYDDLYGSLADDSIKTSEGYINAIIEGVTVGSEAFNKINENASRAKGLRGLSHRYPSTNGLDEKFTRYFVGDVEKGHIKTGLGLGRSYNMDSDGDMGYGFFNFLAGIKSPEEYKKIVEQWDAVEKIQSKTSSYVAQMEARDALEKQQGGETGANLKYTDDFYRKIANTNSDLLGGIQAKVNFNKVGQFSNLATAMRNMMTEKKLDETGLGNDYESQLNAAKAMITRGVFESMEQDAISAKKVEARMIAKQQEKQKALGNNISDEEAYKISLHELDDLLDFFYTERSSAPNAMQTLQERLTEMGVLDEGGSISGRVGAQIKANLSQFSHAEDIFKALGLGKVVELDKDTGLAKIDNESDSMISGQAVSQSLTAMNNKAGGDYTTALQELNWGKHGNANKSAHNNMASTINSIFREYNQEAANSDKLNIQVGDAYAQASNAVDGLSGSFEKLIELQKQDIALEELKTKIALKEAQGYDTVKDSVGELNKEFDELSAKSDIETSIKSPKQNNQSAESFGFGNIYGGENIGVRAGLAQILPGKEGSDIQGLFDALALEREKILKESESGFNKLGTGREFDKSLKDINDGLQEFDKVLPDEDIEGRQFSLLKRMREANSVQERVKLAGFGEGTEAMGNAASAASIVESTDSGLIGHTVSEILIKANEIVKDEVLNTVQDIEKIAKSSTTDSSVATELQTLLNQLDQIKAQAKIDQELLGVKDSALVDKEIDLAVAKGQRAYQMRTSFAEGTYEDIGAEIPVHHTTASGKTFNGKIDVLSMNDEGSVRISDYKFTKDLDPQGILQAIKYANMLSGILERYKGMNLDSEEVKKDSTIQSLLSQGIIDENSLNNLLSKGNPKNIITDIYQLADGRTPTRYRISNPTNPKNEDAQKINQLLSKFENGESLTDEENEWIKNFAKKDLITSNTDFQDGEYNYDELMQTIQDERSKMFKSIVKEDKDALVEYYSKIVSLYAEKLKYDNAGLDTSDIDELIKNYQGKIEEIKDRYANPEKNTAYEMYGSEIIEEKEENGIKSFDIREDIQNQAKVDITPEKAQQLQENIHKKALLVLKEYNELFKNGNELEEEEAKVRQQMSQMTVGSDEYFALGEQLQIIQDKKKVNNEQLARATLSRDNVLNGTALTNDEKFAQTVSENAENRRHAGQMIDISSTKKEMSLVQELFGNFERQLKYMATQSLVYKAIGGVQQAIQTVIQTVKQLDAAMVDLQIASGNTREELLGSMGSFNDIASDMGRSTQDVLTAANDWLRAGYSIEEANSLIRDSMKLSTLGMIDSAEATKDLISTMKGWKLSAGEVSQVVDELTALDMSAATSAGEIAEMMSYGNTSAMMAGTTRQNYEAYLTTAADVSQMGASTVGNAMKTVFARYGNVKAGKFSKNYDASAEEDFEALNDVETVLNKIGIATRNTASEFRDIDDVFEDIASKWTTMDEVTRNSVTTALGGTRQREVLNVLFGNWDEVEDLRKVAAESGGSADAKMPNYLDSIQAAQNRLTAAVEKWATGDKSIGKMDYSTVLGGIYNLLANIVSQADKIIYLVGGFLAISKGKELVSDASNLMSGYNNKMSDIGSTIVAGYNNNGIKKFITGYQDFKEQRVFDLSRLTEEEQAQYSQLKQDQAYYSQMTQSDYDYSDNYYKNISGKLNREKKLNDINNKILQMEDSSKSKNLKKDYFKKRWNDRKSARREVSRLRKLDYLDKGLIKTSGELGAIGETGLDSSNLITQQQYGAARKHILDIAGNRGRYKDFTAIEGKTNAFALLNLSEQDWINSAKAAEAGAWKKFASAKGSKDEEQLQMATKELAKLLGIEGEVTSETIEARGLLTGALKREAGAAEEDADVTVAGDSGDQVRASGKVVGDARTRGNLNGADRNETSKIAAYENILSAGGMVAGMIGTGLWSSHAAGAGKSDEAASFGSMALGMLPMIGGVVGSIIPGVGTAIGTAAGGAVSGIFGIGTLIMDEFKTTTTEANEAMRALSDSVATVKEKMDAISTLDENRNELVELSKGVDLKTGANISLSEGEYQDYTSILTEIASSVAGVYVSTDENGQITATMDGKIVSIESLISQIRERLGSEAQDAAKQQYDSNDNKKIDSKFKSDFNDVWNLENRENAEFTYEDLDNIYNTLDGEKQKTVNELIQDAINEYEKDTGKKPDLNDANVRKDIRQYIPLAAAVSGNVPVALASWVDNGYAQGNVSTKQDQVGKNVATLYMQGSDSYKHIDTNSQEYLSYLMSGFGSGMTADQKASGYTVNQEKLKEGMERLTSHVSGNGAQDFVEIMSFDMDNATKSDVEAQKKRLESLIAETTKDMDEETAAIVSQSIYKRSGFNYNSKTGEYETEKQSNYNTLKDQFSNIVDIDSLTTEQIGTLYKNKDLLKDNNDVDLANKNSILKFIADKTLNNQSSGSEIYSAFKGLVESDAKRTFATNAQFADYVVNHNYKGTGAYDKMMEHAASIGFDVNSKDAEKAESELQKYLDSMELVGDVDLNFHTDKTLSEIQDQYELIDTALNDISGDGRITFDNLSQLITTFGDDILVAANDSETLQAKLNELAETKDIKVAASLTKSLDDSKAQMDAYLADPSKWKVTLDVEQKDKDKNEEDISEDGNVSTALRVAGTISNAMAYSEIYEKYKGMTNSGFGKTDEKEYDFNNMSIAEQAILEVLTGKDATELKEEEIRAAIFEALSAVFGDETANDMTKGGYGQAMMSFMGALFSGSGSGENTGLAGGTASTLANQWHEENVQTAKEINDKMLEDDKEKERVQKEISRVNQLYSDGKLSAQGYINALEELKKSSALTEEEIENLSESIEDAKMAIADYNYSFRSNGIGKGAQEYRQALLDNIAHNVKGSQEDQEGRQKYVQSYKDAIEYEKLRREVWTNEDDYKSKRNSYDKEAKYWIDYGRALRSAGYTTDSPEFLEAIQGFQEANKNKSQTFVDEFSQIESDYERGFISGDEYEQAGKKIIDLAETVGLTSEQFKELNEKMEDYYDSRYGREFEMGQLSAEDYVSNMLKDVWSRNASNSQEEWETIQKVANAFESENQKSQYKRNIAKVDYDYDSQMTAIDEEFKNLAKEAGYLIAGGAKEDSIEVLRVESEMADKYREKGDVVSQRLSDLNKFYSEGYISQIDYRNVLEEIAQEENITAETAMDINESIEDLAAKQYERQVSSGNYDDIWDVIIGYTKDVTGKNAVGSEEWYAGIDKIPDFLNQELSKQQKQLQFIESDDYNSIINSNQSSFESAITAIQALEEIMVKNPVTGELEPLFTENSDEIISLKEQALQALNNQSDAIKNYGERLHNDYSNGIIDMSGFKSGMDEIYKSLQQRVANGEATVEEVVAFKEIASEYYQARLDEYFGSANDGKGITSDNFVLQLEDLIKANVLGQKGGAKYSNWNTVTSAAERYVSYNEKKSHLVEDDDFDAKRGLLDENLDVYRTLLAAAVQIYGPESEQAIGALDQMVGWRKEEAQFNEEQISSATQDWEQGRKNWQETTEILKKAKDQSETKEGYEAAVEASKSVYSDYYTNYAKREGMSTEDILKGYLENVLAHDVKGSKAYYEDIDAMQNIIAKDVELAERNIQLLGEDQYVEKTQGYNDVVSALQEQYQYAYLMGDEELMTEIKLQMKDTFEKINAQISEQISKAETNYSQGYLSFDSYNDVLKEMLDNQYLSNEQRREILEKIEDNTAARIQRRYQMGWISGEQAADQYAEEVVNKNVYDSEDFWNEFDNWLSLKDQVANSALAKAQLVDHSTPEGRAEAKAAIQEAQQARMDEIGEALANGIDENSPKMVELEQSLVDSYDQIAQLTSDAISEASDKYNNGIASIFDYKEELEGIKSEGVQTVEQLYAINQGMRSIYSELLEYGTQYEEFLNDSGKPYDYDDYRQGYIEDVVNNTKKGSGAWFQSMENLLDSYDKQNNNLQQQANLLEKDDYSGRKVLLNQQLNNYIEKYTMAKAAGYREDSDEVVGIKNAILGLYEEMEQQLDQMVSELQNDYNIGKISDQDLSDKLTELINAENMTTEQMERLRETLESVNFDILKSKKQSGIISEADYRDSLVKDFMQENVTNSEQWKSYAEEYKNSIQSEISQLEAQRLLLGNADVDGQVANLEQQIKLLKDQEIAMQAIAKDEAKAYGMSEEAAAKALANSEEYLKVQKQILDTEKQQVQLLVDQAESVMNSYVTLSEYAINLLEDEKDSVADYYDTQISKLEEVNSQKQKSIELLKLEQALESAKKEKTRVYQAGVGFVYTENRAKVKEAQQNLDKYYDEERLDALKNAQNKSNKYFDDLIRKWRDVKDLIDKVQLTTDAQKAVNTLIQTGILSGDANISDALNTIMTNAVWSSNNPVDSQITNLSRIEGALIGEGGTNVKLQSLGTKFDAYANQYTKGVLALSKFEDLGIKADTDHIAGNVDLNNSSVVALANNLAGKYEQANGQVATAVQSVANALNGLNGEIDELSNKLVGKDSGDTTLKSSQDQMRDDIAEIKEKLNKGEYTVKITGSDEKEIKGGFDSSDAMTKAINSAVEAIGDDKKGFVKAINDGGNAALKGLKGIDDWVAAEIAAAKKAQLGNGNGPGKDDYELPDLSTLTSNIAKLNTSISDKNTGLTKRVEELTTAINGFEPGKGDVTVNGGTSAKTIQTAIKGIMGGYQNVSNSPYSDWEKYDESIIGAIRWATGVATNDINKYEKTNKNNQKYSTDLTNSYLADWFNGKGKTPLVKISNAADFKLSPEITVEPSGSAPVATRTVQNDTVVRTTSQNAIYKTVNGVTFEKIQNGKDKGLWIKKGQTWSEANRIMANYGAMAYTLAADGTAYAKGTAFTQGNWGTSTSGQALVGEIGPELLIRNGHYQTIGDKSAEVISYRKGDIIFNADQTEQIMKYGEIIRGRRRGKSFAEGTIQKQIDSSDVLAFLKDVKSSSESIGASPVTSTQSAMLHMSKQSPEYAFDSDQAYMMSQLLGNGDLSYINVKSKSTSESLKQGETYVFNGDIDLPNVQDPSNFMSELINTASRKFNIVNQKYRR